MTAHLDRHLDGNLLGYLVALLLGHVVTLGLCDRLLHLGALGLGNVAALGNINVLGHLLGHLAAHLLCHLL